MTTQAEETLRFKLSLGRFVAKLGRRADEVSVGIASKMAENIIVGGKWSPGTPVDTGNARGSWYPVLNGQPQIGNSSTSGLVALDRVMAAFGSGRAGDMFELWTNTVYMPSLEYGHSQQAPAGMVRLTLRGGQEIANEVAAQ